MTHRVLLASLAAGALTVPLPVSPAVDEPAIREILVRPENPVVRATGSVRLVIDVIAKGAQGKNGVTIKVEPGTPAKPVKADELEPIDGGKTFGPVPETPTPSETPTPVESATPSPSPTSASPTIGEATSWPSPPTADTFGPTPSPSVSPAVRAGQFEPQSAGWATAYPEMRLGDGWETWRFLPARGLNRYYPTGAWTISVTAKGADGRSVTEYAAFTLRHETRLASVRPQKVKGTRAVRLRGALSRVDPDGGNAYAPFARQRVEILHRDSTSGRWTDMGKATTRASGRFAKTVTGQVRGYWRVRYPGNDHYATDQTLPWRIGR